MSVYTIYVVTNEQDLDLGRSRFGAIHFPMGDQACYGLQTHQDSLERLLEKLSCLGYSAIWNERLRAVVVLELEGRLDEVGKMLVEELKSNGWPHRWVTQKDRALFGVQ